jgi:adenylate cyclase
VDSETQLTSIDVIELALESVVPDLSRHSSPDGAITLMLSDIVDASSAAAELGADGWERLQRDHHALVGQLVAHHDGQVVKFENDGFLASFASSHAGLHAAVELQRTFTGSRDNPSLALRVGVHSGFVIADPDKLLGRNVVLTARIAAQARGGEILVSSALKKYTETDPSFHFEPRGEYHFKGLLGEHEIYIVS